ncbi:hypothetical protein [Metabacillus lacus]|nr:hypothetical protein [Metabacillus lacus]
MEVTENSVVDFIEGVESEKKKADALILRQEYRHRFFYRAFAWWPS